MIQYRKRAWAMLLGLFIAVFTFTFLTAKLKDNDVAQAANPWAFDPGYIMSDWQMGNYNSMSEAEIQAFLTAKNPCGNRDWGQYVLSSNSYPTVSWHWANDHFICISEERFGDGMTIGSGDTAAHIIWQTAQDYHINPQVLIVLLEKENGLITDALPHSGQYKTAAGFGCPDTAACDSQYFGFKNQIRRAAALFREVLDGGWTNYPLGMNYVLYNPNRDCGGTMVNIRSLATSALYRYTPYQPNNSALSAGYGVGDGCGAYGNRNFYLFFEDWFGGITKGKDPYVEAKTDYQKTVEDGQYRLISKESGKVADIYGGAVRSGKIQVYNKKPTANDKNVENQIFEIKYESDGYYSIKNPRGGSVFDVRGKETDNNTAIDVYPENDGCNQDWLFKQDDKGYYTIISRCSSRVIDVRQGTNDLIIFDNHNGDNQKWKLEKVDEDDILNGRYQISSKAFPGESIDMEGGLVTRGRLISYTKKPTPADKMVENQIFEIRYDKTDGYYNIINPSTGSAFDVKDGEKSMGNSTPIEIYPLHSKCNQDWKLKRDNDGYYTIESRCSGRVIDLSEATHSLIIFDNHNGNNQKWKLEKVS